MKTYKKGDVLVLPDGAICKLWKDYTVGQECPPGLVEFLTPNLESISDGAFVLVTCKDLDKATKHIAPKVVDAPKVADAPKTVDAPKADDAKPPMSLIVPAFLTGMASVLAFGKKKYDAWSWTKGKHWHRDLDAVLRHVNAWAGGEDTDPESGLNHLLHGSVDLMFLYVQQFYKLGTDDRKKF